MTMLFIYSLLLIALAYLVGCVLGCLARRLFGGLFETAKPSAAAAAATATAGVAATSAIAAKTMPSTDQTGIEAGQSAKAVASDAGRATTPPPAAAIADAKTDPKGKSATSAPVAKTKQSDESDGGEAGQSAEDVKKDAGKATTPPSAKAVKDAKSDPSGISTSSASKSKPAAAKPKPPAKPKPAAPEAAATTTASGVASAAAISAASVDMKVSDDKKAAAEKADAVGTRPKVLAAPIGGKKDNLKRVKGIGPKNEDSLNSLGVFHFSQIASWAPEESKWMGSFMAFPGRIERESWISQADDLAAGRDTEFSKRVDKGQVSSSIRGGSKK